MTKLLDVLSHEAKDPLAGMMATLKIASLTLGVDATRDLDGLEDRQALVAAAAGAVAEASTHTACLALCHLQNAEWIFPGELGMVVRTKCIFTRNSGG